MRIHKRYTGVIIGAIVSTILSAIVSLFVTYQNMGFTESIFSQWMAAWWKVWPLAFVLAIIVTPPAKRLAERITSDDV